MVIAPRRYPEFGSNRELSARATDQLAVGPNAPDASDRPRRLLNADANAMTGGANLAMIGDELIQFGQAEQLEPGLFRLSRLLRGRRGTEWTSGLHHEGERFCLFDLSALAAVDLPSDAISAELTAISHGVADVAPLPEVRRLVSGEAMRPPSVCHLRASRVGSDVDISWVRRSLRGWSWNDGVGVPSDSFPERYRLTIAGPAGEVDFESDGPRANLNVEELPGEAGQNIEIDVRTIGPMALSHPQRTSLTL